MACVDRLQRYLSPPQPENLTSTSSDGILEGANTDSCGHVDMAGGQIVVNWQALFNATPPDPSEFNLIFNNHNLIEDDKLSIHTPPQSPARSSSTTLEAPPTPKTTVTYLDDRDYRSPTDTHSSGEIEYVKVHSNTFNGNKSASLGRKAQKRTCSSTSYSDSKFRGVFPIPEDRTAVRAAADKARKRSSSSAKRRTPPTNPRLINYGMV